MKIIKKLIIFLILFILIFIVALVVFSESEPPPNEYLNTSTSFTPLIASYDQGIPPEIIFGKFSSGEAFYLNVLGIEQTYNVEETSKTVYEEEVLFAEYLNTSNVYCWFELNASGPFDNNEANCYSTLNANNWVGGNLVDAVINNSQKTDKTFTSLKYSIKLRYLGTPFFDDYFKIQHSLDDGITWIDSDTFTTISSPTIRNYTTSATSWSDVNHFRVRIIYVQLRGSDNTLPSNLYIDGYEVYVNYSSLIYKAEVWHNSYQIEDGNIGSVNVTLNFSSTSEDLYALQIYNWANSQWTSTRCDSGNVLPNAPTQWWCNETSNAMNYNSSDGRIRIRITSNPDTDLGLLKERYLQYYVGYIP